MAETQADYFIRIKGKKQGEIKGESQKGNKTDWILVNSFNWGANQPGMAHAGSKQTGAATFNTFNFVIELQGASPKLHSMLATNEGLDLELVCRAGTGAEAEDYYALTFKDARLISYGINGSGYGHLPSEDYRVSYMQFDEVYKGKKGDQTHNTNISFHWDVAKGE
jgi:type VI secretion system Hcp family effector